MFNLDRAFPYQKSHMAITPLLIILGILSVVCYGPCGLTGNRTRHTAVTGRRYSRLTMGPKLIGDHPIVKWYIISFLYRIRRYFRNIFEPPVGLEPTTCWLQISCSTKWATEAKSKKATWYIYSRIRYGFLHCIMFLKFKPLLCPYYVEDKKPH